MTLSPQVAGALETLFTSPAGRVGAHEDESAREASYDALVSSYLEADAAGREAIRRALPGDARALWVLAERSTDRSIAEQQPEQLLFALVAHSIEDLRWDARDSSLRLQLIWDAAKRLATPPDALFERVAQLSSARTAEFLREFASDRAKAPARRTSSRRRPVR